MTATFATGLPPHPYTVCVPSHVPVAPLRPLPNLAPVPGFQIPAAAATREGPRPLARSSIDWSQLWRQLMSAQVRFRNALWMEGKCVVVFRRTAPTVRQFALTSREQNVFLRTLRAERQKQIALECKIATSTVANCFKAAIDKLGFNGRLDTAPLAALVLSHAPTEGTSSSPVAIFSISEGDYLLAHAPRPRWERLPHVTPSERQIADLIIEGRPNSYIAQVRQTSVHTVENQVASLFRKLGASGRFDLLRVLYLPAGSLHPNSTPLAAPSLPTHPALESSGLRQNSDIGET